MSNSAPMNNKHEPEIVGLGIMGLGIVWGIMGLGIMGSE